MAAALAAFAFNRSDCGRAGAGLRRAGLRQPFQMHGLPIDNSIVGRPQLYNEIN